MGGWRGRGNLAEPFGHTHALGGSSTEFAARSVPGARPRCRPCRPGESGSVSTGGLRGGCTGGPKPGDHVSCDGRIGDTRLGLSRLGILLSDSIFTACMVGLGFVAGAPETENWLRHFCGGADCPSSHFGSGSRPSPTLCRLMTYRRLLTQRFSILPNRPTTIPFLFREPRTVASA